MSWQQTRRDKSDCKIFHLGLNRKQIRKKKNYRKYFINQFTEDINVFLYICQKQR